MDVDFSTQSDYAEQEFSDIQLGGIVITGKRFEQCTFSKCGFIQTHFTDCRFIDCTFTESQLSAVHFDRCSFMETTFKQSKVIGIDWTKAASIRALHFYNCDASQSFFDALKLPQLILKDCVVHEADFTGADCSKADFQGTDFEKTVFSQTNLTEANLNHTFNYSIDFRSNTLKKTKFSLPEATSLLGALDIILT